ARRGGGGGGAGGAGVGGGGMGGAPPAAGVPVEVVAGLHRLVERRGVEAGGHGAHHRIGGLRRGLAPRRGGRRRRGRSRGACGGDERKQQAERAERHG